MRDGSDKSRVQGLSLKPEGEKRGVNERWQVLATDTAYGVWRSCEVSLLCSSRTAETAST